MKIPFYMNPKTIPESADSYKGLTVEDFYGIPWYDALDHCVTAEDEDEALRWFRRGWFYAQLCEGEAVPEGRDNILAFASNPYRLCFDYGGHDTAYGSLSLIRDGEVITEIPISDSEIKFLIS